MVHIEVIYPGMSGVCGHSYVLMNVYSQKLYCHQLQLIVPVLGVDSVYVFLSWGFTFGLQCTLLRWKC